MYYYSGYWKGWSFNAGFYLLQVVLQADLNVEVYRKYADITKLYNLIYIINWIIYCGTQEPILFKTSPIKIRSPL